MEEERKCTPSWLGQDMGSIRQPRSSNWMIENNEQLIIIKPMLKQINIGRKNIKTIEEVQE